MSPDIFIDNFEITENTEELHAILGRSLIIATRFDNLCVHVTTLLEINKDYCKIKYAIMCAIMSPNDKFHDYVNKLSDNRSTLYDKINDLPFGPSEKKRLHKARLARNEIAHAFTVGMTGCLDIKIDEQSFKHHISDLVMKISAGDFIISTIISILNKDPLPNYSESNYKKRILNWVNGE